MAKPDAQHHTFYAALTPHRCPPKVLFRQMRNYETTLAEELRFPVMLHWVTLMDRSIIAFGKVQLFDPGVDTVHAEIKEDLKRAVLSLYRLWDDMQAYEAGEHLAVHLLLDDAAVAQTLRLTERLAAERNERYDDEQRRLNQEYRERNPLEGTPRRLRTDAAPVGGTQSQ
jgi:hypothetical protein